MINKKAGQYRLFHVCFNC